MSSVALDCTYNSSLSDISTLLYDKAFMLFDLSSIPSGAVISAASLVLTLQFAPALGSVSVTVVSSNANVAWDETTAVATLDAYTLSASIATFTINTTDTPGVTTYTSNVLGTGSKGITEAWALGNKATLALTSGAIAAVNKTASISVANMDKSDMVPHSTAGHPVLTVTYTARGKMVKVPMDGHSF